MKARSFVVWGASSLLILGVFLILVAAGWPGEPNSCTETTPNTCYCEAFDLAEVRSGAGGVRQPVNTWFNLYSLLTSLLVAVVVFADRKAGRDRNPMQGHAWIPDLYVFAVLFLGLGSMWFHASLKAWGGVFDQLSMFTFTVFLIFYTVYRLWPSDWFFGIGYAVTVALATVICALWDWEYQSLVVILALVVVYLALEVAVNIRDEAFMQGKPLTIGLWLGAVGSILLATLFWVLSQTDSVLCSPDSAFQPHGLLWHPLAGVMAVLLYFYWRAEEPASR